MSSQPSIRDRARENATGIVATTVTGTWLAALMLGVNWWLAAMLFGYIVLVPITSMLFDPDESTDSDETESKNMVDPTDTESTTNADGPLERVRTEYAEGRLTDEEFEDRLERLLETETLQDAAEWVDREDGTGVGDRTREEAITEREGSQ